MAATLFLYLKEERKDSDAEINQTVQKLFEGMMACTFQCRNSVGDEIFRISMPNELDKALLSTLTPYWDRKVRTERAVMA
ncbi:hypothetical protein CPY51_15075 [Rhizobium tubonense]|uniref:Uncharacterized protein n=1 Tax=Rhizobium tubonense TaxID=484088 RepID=A0A2W4CIU0_9HYPH|nr:hypothetical protein CPY51_15075 [Rhizobium tubonense]